MKLITRRDLMVGFAAGGLLSVAARPARAALSREETYDAAAAIRAVIGDRPTNPGRITLELPTLAGSGNSVSLTVKVDSPMTPTDYVKRIDVFADRNPRPHIMSVHLNQRSGRAECSTRIRLNSSQNVIAIAEMSDGSLYRVQSPVEVTIGACDSLLFRF